MHPDPRFAEIHRAAARWASRWWISENDFLATVTGTRLRRLELARLRARGASRHVVARHQPFEGPGRPAAPIAAEGFDPLAGNALVAGDPDPPGGRMPGLRRRQEGVLPGLPRQREDPLSRLPGLRPRRLGAQRQMDPVQRLPRQGERGCRDCRTGRVECRGCEGRGKVFRWLDLEERPLDEVLAEPRNALGDALAGCSFDLPAEELPVPPSFTWSGAPPSLPPELRPFAQKLLGRFDPRHDRIARLDYQAFAAEVATVDYALWGRGGSVEVPSWNLEVRDWPESAEPLRHRRSTLGAAALVAAAAGVALAAWYGGRHAYLAATPNFPLLFVLAFLLGLALGFAVSRLGLAAEGSPAATCTGCRSC